MRCQTWIAVDKNEQEKTIERFAWEDCLRGSSSESKETISLEVTVWSINDLRGKVSLKIGNNVTGVRSCDDTRREDVVRLALLVLRELRLLGGDWGSEAEEGVHYCFRVGAVWHKVRGVRQRGTKNGLVSLTTCGDLPLSLG